MSDQPNIILPDDEETALIALDAQGTAIDTVSLATDAIVDALDYLHTTGADPGALDDIHGGAIDLVEAAQQLDNAFKSAFALAKSFRDQREEARQALIDFQDAVDRVDVSVPEIQELWQAIEEMNMDWLSYSLFDEWDKLVEELINTTPLDEHEARALTNVLGSEELPKDHTLWAVLREWIADAQQVMTEERDA